MSDSTIHPEKEQHEITVWRARPFVIGVCAFFVFMPVLFLIIGILASSWNDHTWPLRHAPESPQSSPAWTRETPQLQVNPPQDLAAMRKAEYQQLHSLHWTDDTHAYAVIPIDEAMKRLAQAAADHEALLPAPKPATPIELQRQKSIANPERPAP